MWREGRSVDMEGRSIGREGRSMESEGRSMGRKRRSIWSERRRNGEVEANYKKGGVTYGEEATYGDRGGSMGREGRSMERDERRIERKGRRMGRKERITRREGRSDVCGGEWMNKVWRKVCCIGFEQMDAHACRTLLRSVLEYCCNSLITSVQNTHKCTPNYFY